MTSSFTPGAPASSSRRSERSGEHVLEVVEQQQRLPVAQVLEQRLTRRASRPFLDPELIGDRPRDESRRR